MTADVVMALLATWCLWALYTGLGSLNRRRRGARRYVRPCVDARGGRK